MFGRRPRQCGGAFVANRAVGIGQAKLHRQIIRKIVTVSSHRQWHRSLQSCHWRLRDGGHQPPHPVALVVDGLEPGGGRGGWASTSSSANKHLPLGWLARRDLGRSVDVDAGPDQMIGHRTARRTYSSHQHRSGPSHFVFSPNAFEQGLAVVPMQSWREPGDGGVNKARDARGVPGASNGVLRHFPA